jgi:16S rRNA (guanine1207-N2)-methyltransferase
MNPALETLFLAVKTPAPGAAFLNARYHPALRPGMVLQQYFKPYTDELRTKGFETSPDVKTNKVPAVYILLPKNMIEAKHLIARGLSILAEDGQIICAAANDAGGSRLKKILQSFGLEDIHELSKNKARAASAVKKNISDAALKEALKEGAMQNVLDGSFQSMPGLFAWDRADKGSEILAKYLPGDLKGRGADFGCGYGWLSRHILENCKGVENLICIDADVRAIESCTENLKQFSNVNFVWADLTKEPQKSLDWIVMNPPFHEGKYTNADIGRAFIATAAKSLKKGGQLWMVANANLPYEDVLKAMFSGVDKLFEGHGFKVFCATI